MLTSAKAHNLEIVLTSAWLTTWQEKELREQMDSIFADA